MADLQPDNLNDMQLYAAPSYAIASTSPSPSPSRPPICIPAHFIFLLCQMTRRRRAQSAPSTDSTDSTDSPSSQTTPTTTLRRMGQAREILNKIVEEIQPDASFLPRGDEDSFDIPTTSMPTFRYGGTLIVFSCTPDFQFPLQCPHVAIVVFLPYCFMSCNSLPTFSCVEAPATPALTCIHVESPSPSSHFCLLHIHSHHQSDELLQPQPRTPKSPARRGCLHRPFAG
jgi:hypothetical protein